MQEMEDLKRGDKPITAGQLRTWLNNVPDDTPIVMSSDAEGNNFSPLAEVSPEHYVAESTWSGFLVHPDDDDPNGYGIDDAEQVIVVWPTN